MLFPDDKQGRQPDRPEMPDTPDSEDDRIISDNFILTTDARLFLEACLKEGHRFMTRGERQHLKEVIKKTIINNPQNANETQEIIDRVRWRLKSRRTNFMIVFPFLFKKAERLKVDPEPDPEPERNILIMSRSGRRDLKSIIRKYGLLITRSEKKVIRDIIKDGFCYDMESINKIMASTITRKRNRKDDFKNVFPFLF